MQVAPPQFNFVNQLKEHHIFRIGMVKSETYILRKEGLSLVSLLFLVSPVQRVVLLLAYIPQVLQSCLKERNCARPKRPDVTQFICFTK